MAKANNKRSLFKESRVNEIHPDLIGIAAVNPFINQVSSSRIQMRASQATQFLVVEGRNPPRIQSGIDSKFGKYTYGTVLEHDSRLIRSIKKFPRRSSIDYIKENPRTTHIVEYAIEDSMGRYKKIIDYVDVDEYHEHTTGFGYRTSKPEPVSDRMPAETVLSQSPAVDENGNYCYGIDANVAMMTIPQVIEDGVAVSESFVDKLTTTGVQTYSMSWGKSQFPLNIYGDDTNYKIFPEVGDTVNEDGILMAFREYDDDLSPIMMTQNSLKVPDFKYDECIYVQAGAKVVDIKVYHDTRLARNIRGKNPHTPVGMSNQAEKYYNEYRRYYQDILNVYEDIKKEQARNEFITISPKFNRLLVEAQAICTTGDKNKIIRTYRGKPIDEWHVDITIAYPIKPNIGFKITANHGDKAVICDILPDEYMPTDQDGNVADIAYDPLSTVNRMNVGRVVEQYINAASRDLTKRLREMHAAGAGHKEMSDTLLGYYRIVSPRMADLLIDNNNLISKEHIESVLDKGIYLWVPTDNEPETFEIIRDIQEQYPATRGPVSYVNVDGERTHTTRPVLIGSMYVMLLEKTGKYWSSVSMSKLNLFGSPSKLTAVDRNSSPVRVQPIRFGESEVRLFTAFVGGGETADLLDRTNNPFARKKIHENILKAHKPTAIETVVDRAEYPTGQGRILNLTVHINECFGNRLVKNDGSDV